MNNSKGSNNNFTKDSILNKRSYNEFKNQKDNNGKDHEVISIHSDDDTENELRTQCPPTPSTRKQESNHSNVTNKTINNSPKTSQYPEKEAMKIVRIWFEPNKKAFMYKVECKLHDKVKRYRYLTKQEILKEDPLLLVYFYESHIEFNKEKFQLRQVNQS